MWHIYILLCDNSIFYVGLTNDIERRIKEHLSGYFFYTKKFKKIELVYKELHDSRIKAEKREQQLKKWSAAKKKALISNELELLRNLSKALGLSNSFRVMPISSLSRDPTPGAG